MSDKAITFCDSVHAILEALEGRVEVLKSNVGATWHCLKDKLDELGRDSESTTRTATESRRHLEEWLKEKRLESRSTIECWVANGETDKLAARAKKTEGYAVMAFAVARASIDDVERLVLEAIAAERHLEAVTVTRPQPVSLR